MKEELIARGESSESKVGDADLIVRLVGNLVYQDIVELNISVDNLFLLEKV